MPSPPSRRRFLKLGIAGAVLFPAGVLMYRTFGTFGSPAPGYRTFDERELAVLGAVADAYFPGPPDQALSGREAGCVEFVDRYVHHLYPDNRVLLRALLRTLDVSTLASHRSRFTDLSDAERLTVLETWAASSLRVRRAGHSSLTLFVKMGYFENDRVREHLGYTLGCEVPQDGRPQGV
ncbi:MAG: gluconate 2-dehydrogenase subunit 3 family protein [Archangiaceae bacterium]|nr:gluconate 2-dehydrogenase subunit 3 family protein [Archangiaceae bacterium]